MPYAPFQREQTRRGFNVSDGIVLVAAVSLALAMSRDGWLLVMRAASITMDEIPIYSHLSVLKGPILFLDAASVSLPLLLNLTVASLALRLRLPRPPLNEVLRQPGAAASSAVVFVVVMSVALIPTEALLAGINPHIVYYSILERMSATQLETRLDGSTRLFSCVVSTVWLFLLCLKELRPEKSWLDKFGTVLGCAWIISYPISTWVCFPIP